MERTEPEHFTRAKHHCGDAWKGNIQGKGECVFTVIGTYKERPAIFTGTYNEQPIVCIYEPETHWGKRVALNWQTGEVLHEY